MQQQEASELTERAVRRSRAVQTTDAILPIDAVPARHCSAVTGRDYMTVYRAQHTAAHGLKRLTLSPRVKLKGLFRGVLHPYTTFVRRAALAGAPMCNERG